MKNFYKILVETFDKPGKYKRLDKDTFLIYWEINAILVQFVPNGNSIYDMLFYSLDIGQFHMEVFGAMQEGFIPFRKIIDDTAIRDFLNYVISDESMIDIGKIGWKIKKPNSKEFKGVNIISGSEYRMVISTIKKIFKREYVKNGKADCIFFSGESNKQKKIYTLLSKQMAKENKWISKDFEKYGKKFFFIYKDEKIWPNVQEVIDTTI